MDKIRILYGKDVNFLRGFFGESFDCQENMEVVGEYDDPIDLLVSLRDTDADVVILSKKHYEALGLPSHIFAEYPIVTLVLIEEDYCSVLIEHLYPLKHHISNVTPESIICALQAAVMSREKVIFKDMSIKH